MTDHCGRGRGKNRLAAITRIRNSILHYGTLVLLLQLPGMAVTAFGQAEQGGKPNVGVAPVLARDDQVTAILTPLRQAVLSAEVAGRVVSIKKELGQRFAADEALINLDDTIYNVNTRMAEALVKSAEGNLDRARKLIENQTRQRHAEAVLAAAKANHLATQRLYKDSNASHIDLMNAQRDVTVAKTNCELVDSNSAKELDDAEHELAIAIGRLEIAMTQLRSCAITVPWSGRASRVLVSEGEFVNHGTPVIEAIDDRVLIVKFLLPSMLFQSIGLGQELGLTVIETSERISVRVSHIAAALDPASVTFEVHAEAQNADGRLRAGMNGLLSISEIKENEG